MKRATLPLAIVLAASALAACAEDVPVHRPAKALGEELMTSTSTSPQKTNVYSCATCHLLGGTSSDIFPGANLGGVTRRPSFWGGQEQDLLRSINHCRTFFMGAVTPWSSADRDALAVLAYLESLEGDGSPAPFDIVYPIAPIPNGDATGGAKIYDRACALCHGSAHRAEGRLTTRAPILPEETLRDHANYTRDEQRLVFIEKVRHGTFLGYGGDMPPFSRGALPDEQLGAILAYLLP